MAAVLVDTGVWYSFFDPTDTCVDRDTVQALIDLIEPMTIVIPWPVTYETLRTRFARNRNAMLGFEQQLQSPRACFVEDGPYREDALRHCFESMHRGRPLSLLDCLLRTMVSDVNQKIEYLATYNDADFADVCAGNGVQLLPG